MKYHYTLYDMDFLVQPCLLQPTGVCCPFVIHPVFQAAGQSAQEFRDRSCISRTAPPLTSDLEMYGCVTGSEEEARRIKHDGEKPEVERGIS